MAEDMTFGALLRLYRARSHDPATGRMLSQEGLGDLLNLAAGTIHYWEADLRRPRAEDRLILIRLLKALAKYNGISTPTEADTLLDVGRYAPLSETELRQHFGKWLPSESPEAHPPPKTLPEAGRKGVVTIPTPPPQPVQRWPQRILRFFCPSLHLPALSPDQSRLAAVVICLLGRPAEVITPHRVLRGAGLLVLWVLATLAWQGLLGWPYPDGSSKRLGCAGWGIATVLLPLFLGLGSPADDEASLLEQTGDRRGLRFYRWIGAGLGYQIGAGIVLFVALVCYYLALWPWGSWLVASMALLPLLIAYAGARKSPNNQFKAYATSRGEGRALRVEGSDLLLGVAALVPGPLIAALLFFYEDWVLHPIIGPMMLIGVVAGVAGLEVLGWTSWRGEVVAPLVCLGLGLPLSGLLLVAGVEPLYGLGFLAVTLSIAAQLRWDSARIKLWKLLSLLCALTGLLWIVAYQAKWSWVGFVALGLVVVIWLRDLWRALLPTGIVFGACAGGIALLRWTTAPGWAVRLAFGLVALAVLAGELQHARRALRPRNAPDG